MTASKTIGKGGPILLEDTNYINHLAHFDREKIPERIVHAKGAGAHGYFEVTNDISNYTRAALFAGVGKRTPLFVRFSSVGYESGSADTIHDPRGFAVKFYTELGNWDLVGNNLLVFPIRDPILFPSLIRSRRRNPKSHLKDANMFWDFTSLRPESTHHTLQLFSELGYPDGFRHMDGGGVHTFKLVNSQNEPVYVKFHWRTNQGVKNISAAYALELAGTNPEYYTEDLYRAIEAGDYPSWNMSIQVMTFEQAANYRWNPFDITKLWLESDFPLIPVGVMTLNQNPVDYFSETENAAFDPGNLVPGIEVSPDPMLHGRSFSYTDTQRYRLGANFQQLPINRPRSPAKVNSYDRDGACAIENGDGGPNYFPNSFNGPVVSPVGAESVFAVSGDVVREDTVDDDNFSQSKIFLDSLSPEGQSILIENLAMSLQGANAEIRARTFANFVAVDESFGNAVKTYVDQLLQGRPRSLDWRY